MVLDQQHGQVELVADPPDELAELVDLAVGEAGGRLVEHQQLGLARQGPGQLDALERAVRQAGGRTLGEVTDVEAVEQVVGLLPGVSRSSRRARGSRNGAETNPALVSAWPPTITLSSTDSPSHRATFWNVRAMPMAAMAWAGRASRSSPSKRRLALGRLVEAADHVEQGRLAGAVRTDQRADLTLVDREAEPVERDDAAEPDADVLHLQQRQVGPPPIGRPDLSGWHPTRWALARRGPAPGARRAPDYSMNMTFMAS